MKGLSGVKTATHTQQQGIVSKTKTGAQPTFKGKAVFANHSGILKFLAATYRGMESKVSCKLLSERKASAEPTKKLREAMVKQRDKAVKALAGGDTAKTLEHCYSLSDKAFSALPKGDPALTNGGMYTLGQLGCEVIKTGHMGTAKKIAAELHAKAKEALDKHELGTAQTINAALRLMRHEAQQAERRELSEDLLLKQQNIILKQGAVLAAPLICSGKAAIESGDLPALKAIIKDESFGLNTSTATQTLEELTKFALEKGDEALANTLALEFKVVAQNAASRDHTDGLVQITLAMNRVEAYATKLGFQQTPALMRVNSARMTEEATKLSGGVASYLTQFPISDTEMATAAAETMVLVEKSIAEGDMGSATRYLLSLNDVSQSLIQRGASKEILQYMPALVSIGHNAAVSGNMDMQEAIDYLFASIGRECEKAEVTEVAKAVAQAHGNFKSATAATQLATLSAKALSADNLPEMQEAVRSLRDAGVSLIRNGATKEAVLVARSLSEIGRNAAAASKLPAVDYVTDALIKMSDECAHAGYHTTATQIAREQLTFESAWDLALSHKGTETENIEHFVPEHMKPEDLA